MSQFASDLLARSRTCVAGDGSAEELPSPSVPRSLGGAHGAQEFAKGESVLNVHCFRDSYSHVGPDRLPKIPAAAQRHHFCPVV